MAKKYVRAVARSNLDLESRKDVRQKEAELAVRRKAAFIGKEVGMLLQCSAIELHASICQTTDATLTAKHKAQHVLLAVTRGAFCLTEKVAQ